MRCVRSNEDRLLTQSGSKAPFSRSAGYFRPTAMNRHSLVQPEGRFRASSGLWAQGPFYGIVVEKAEHRMMEVLIPFLVDRPLSDHDEECSERTTGTSGQSDI